MRVEVKGCKVASKPNIDGSNPVIVALLKTFEVKRQRSGLLPRNWIIIVLILLDKMRKKGSALHEDETYNYDFVLINSRSDYHKLFEEYQFPSRIGLGTHNVTVRGAPAYRMFRELKGGEVIDHLPADKRNELLLEAIEVIRKEVMLIVGSKSIELPSNVFSQTRLFVNALIEASKNRSGGRVEQALVGSKLQLRFPDETIPDNPGFAGDKQTGRESDFEIGDLRVIVSVSPHKDHFLSAQLLSDEGRQVFLVVASKNEQSAKKRIALMNLHGSVVVSSVQDYVTSNMMEISHIRKLSSQQMCLELAKEYNRRIVADNDPSLAVDIPSELRAP